jgi:hypothetical protein
MMISRAHANVCDLWRRPRPYAARSSPELQYWWRGSAASRIVKSDTREHLRWRTSSSWMERGRVARMDGSIPRLAKIEPEPEATVGKRDCIVDSSPR